MADQLTEEQIAECRQAFLLAGMGVSPQDVPALMDSVGCAVTGSDMHREGLKDRDRILFPDFVKLIVNSRKEQTLSQVPSDLTEVSETHIDRKVKLLVVYASGESVLDVSLEQSCLVSDLVTQVREAHAMLEKAKQHGDAKSCVLQIQPQLTDEETEEVRQIFSQFCAKGADAMEASHFGSAMGYLDQRLTEAELEDIVAHYSSQSSGFIDFPTFLGLLGAKMESGTFGEGVGRRDRTFLLSPVGFRLFEEETLCQNGLKDGDTVTLAIVAESSYAMYKHPEFTDAEMEEFRKAFNHFSKAGGDGDVIHSSELGHALRMLGQNPTEAELLDMIAEVDADGSGVIDFPEFLSLNCRKLDIGTWGQHDDTIGVEILRGHPYTISDCRMIIQSFGRTPNPTYFCLDCDYLGSRARNALIGLADSKHTAGVHDLKINLSWLELESIVGVDVANTLVAMFPHRIDEIKIRRVQADGEKRLINFHTDVSLKTMQVALNGDDECQGGRLMYVTADGLQQPARGAGTLTIHDNTVPHGVSELIRDRRYGLYFITK